MRCQTAALCCFVHKRCFATALSRYADIRPLKELPDRIYPQYHREQLSDDLLSLKWPEPPRNILLVQKDRAPNATRGLLRFAKHIKSEYPSVNFILDYRDAHLSHEPRFTYPVFVRSSRTPKKVLAEKVDIIATFGGDGTILRASSLFAAASSVPPILSFSFGTLGFLSEEKHKNHKAAWRNVYRSGLPVSANVHEQFGSSSGKTNEEESDSVIDDEQNITPNESLPGQVKVLLRTRLKVSIARTPEPSNRNTTTWPEQEGLEPSALEPEAKEAVILDEPGTFASQTPGDASTGEIPTTDFEEDSIAQAQPNDLSPASSSSNSQRNDDRTPAPASSPPPPPPPFFQTHALNEIVLHRGQSPHLTHLTLLLNDRPLTSAIADGLIISTPTGSTAYSLSSGGSIVHPLVKSIVVTPICARSLSFRPLVLPATAKLSVVVTSSTRGGAVDVIVDGEKISKRGLLVGERVDVVTEGVEAAGGRVSEVGEREGGVSERAGEEGVQEEYAGGRRVDEVGMDRSGEFNESIEASSQTVNPSTTSTEAERTLPGAVQPSRGVPCIVQPCARPSSSDEGWVDGLNGLLKFNYPFGNS